MVAREGWTAGRWSKPEKDVNKNKRVPGVKFARHGGQKPSMVVRWKEMDRTGTEVDRKPNSGKSKNVVVSRS